MAISVKQDVMNQATALLQRLEAKMNSVDDLSPQEQASVINEMLPESKILTQLQQKVEAARKRQSGAIPGVSDDELATISKQLSFSAEILVAAEQDQSRICTYFEIFPQVQSLAQSATPNPAQVALLTERVRNFSRSPGLASSSMLKATEALQSTLLAMTRNAPNRSQVPASHDNSSQPPSGNTAPRGNGSHLTVNVHPKVAIMQNLNLQLPKLDFQTAPGQLNIAWHTLYTLSLEGKKSVFKMSGQEQRSIGDRPFYHIYIIHKNETPEKLKNDMEYGGKAFSGAYPATNEERKRCVQRTIVELALENIEDAINFDNGELLVHSLDLLERVKLDINDRAEGQENAAFNLFSAFYHLHVAARSSHPTLVNPSDSQFGGDFGRAAFRKGFNGVDPAVKLQAVEQVRDALKAAWKV